MATTGSNTLQKMPTERASLHETPATSEPAGVPSAPPRIAGRILLAEDSPDNQRLLCFYLKKAGAQVTLADNGRCACESVSRAAAQGEPFDLVVMDMQMPELDGYRAASRLRAQGHEVPILALTADSLPEDRVNCIQSGCNEYMQKPADPAVLLSTVARMLPEGALAGTSADGADGFSLPPAADHFPSDDGGPLHSPLSDNPETAQFLTRFVEGLPGQIQELLELSEQADRAQLAAALHGLKGTAGFYGFPAITEHASALEERLRVDAVPPDVLREEIETLVALTRRVEGYNTIAHSPSGAASGPSRSAARAAPGQKVVLVVEDMAVIRDPIAASLESAGYRTLVASNGAEALRVVREAKRIDLILLDVRMPRMDGLAFLSRLRNDPAKSHLPVILLSAAEAKHDILAAAKYGVRGYLLKSRFSLPDLLLRVKGQLDQTKPPHPAAT